MNGQIGRVSRDSFGNYWPVVSRHLQCYAQKWLETEDLDDIGQRLAKGELDLWILVEDNDMLACGICGWTKGPKFSIYHIAWCGGHRVMEFLSRGLQLVEQYACLQGASEIRLEGRDGWQRILTPYGYTPVVQMKKNVKMLWRM